MSGTAYQAIFLNPLVSPGILGVLAGASFGAALGLVFLKSWFAVQVSTFLGGIAAVGFSLVVARIYRGGQTVMLVLGGIISGALFTALVSVLKFLADPYNQLPVITSWLMGNMAMADRATAIDRQPQAQSAIAFGDVEPALLEGIEDARQCRRLDALAGIADFHPQPAVLGGGGVDGDRSHYTHGPENTCRV